MDNLHLVTGYAGKAHVASSDHGSAFEAAIRSGQYVMEAGEGFSASAITNNQVRVKDGELMMQGRQVKLDPGSFADLTIDNGTQGVNRHDLIVARYTKDTATGIESCNLIVIKGTATDGPAPDPAVMSGKINTGESVVNDFPLHRVVLSGINISRVEQLFVLQKSVFDSTLHIAGGTMQGPLNMGGQLLKGLPEPTENGDAVPMEYVVPKSGGEFKGSVTISLGKSKGFVTITEDVEGGTIQVGSPNGTYVYEIDSPNNEEIRVHTKTSPSGVAHKQFAFNGRTGDISTDNFSTKIYKTSSGTGFDAIKAMYPSLQPGIVLVDAMVGSVHCFYLVEKANNSYGSALFIAATAFVYFKLDAGKWTAIEK